MRDPPSPHLHGATGSDAQEFIGGGGRTGNDATPHEENHRPSTAARGWKTLVTPGIMCGILGYAIGTFIDVAVAKLLMQS